ncbi:MAG: FUSC family protein [Geminicoccaceae bacterium]
MSLATAAPTRAELVTAARITLALVGPAAWFMAFGTPGEAILAAIAGLYLGIVDPDGETLAVRLLAGLAVMPLLVLALELGILVSPQPLLVVTVVPLLAFAAGLVNLFGPKASPGSLFVLQALIVGAGMPVQPPLAELLGAGLAGCGWALLLTLLFAGSRLEPPVDAAGLAGLRQGLRTAWPRLRAVLAAPHGRPFRHAARLGIGIASAEGLAFYGNLPHGLWVPLTVAIILKPDAAGTRAAALQRIAGSTGGGLVAALLAATLLSPWTQLAAITPLAFAAFTLLGRRYALGVACLTPMVILLVDLADPGEWHWALARVGDTAVGGLVALAMIALLPQLPEDGKVAR